LGVSLDFLHVAGRLDSGQLHTHRFAVYLLALCLPFAPVPAFAHAHLISSAPAASSEVARPHQIVLAFTGGVRPGSANVTLKSATKKIGVGAPRLKASGRVLSVSLPVLSSGTYTVQWGATSTDGHRSTGSFSFRVK
jgi:copper resistance protein C